MITNFHIVNNSTFDLKVYENSDFAKQNKNTLEKLRALLNFIEPQHYRGIGRTSFTTDPFHLNKNTGEIITYANNKQSLNENKAAKHRLLELIKKRTDDTSTDFYFADTIELNSVFDKLDNKINFEKIATILNQTEFLPNSFGFDIGYCSGEFSIIADVAIKPTWHLPDFDDMNDIILQLQKLNAACLFNTYQDALDYKNIYLSKKWAEENWYENDNDKEGDIKIMLVKPA